MKNINSAKSTKAINNATKGANTMKNVTMTIEQYNALMNAATKSTKKTNTKPTDTLAFKAALKLTNFIGWTTEKVAAPVEIWTRDEMTPLALEKTSSAAGYLGSKLIKLSNASKAKATKLRVPKAEAKKAGNSVQMTTKEMKEFKAFQAWKAAQAK